MEGVIVALLPLPEMPTVGMAQRISATAISVPRYATTDARGRYAFEHVYPDRECQVFVPMAAVAKHNLFAHRQHIHSGRSGATTEAAELNLHPAHRLTGQIVTSDNRPLPPGAIVVLERTRVRDLQRSAIDGTGGFSFDAVPSESVVLSFHTSGNQAVPGYRLSRKNYSIHPTAATLCGWVDDDRQLLVLFEPGSGPRYAAGAMNAWPGAAGVVVRGNVAIVQQVVVQRNGQRVVVRQAIQQGARGPTARDLQPLSGVTEDDLSRMDMLPKTAPSRR